MPDEGAWRRADDAAPASGRGWILARTQKGGGVLALVIVSTFVVLLLGILVAGLLRSHADILRSLHELGVGVGDPTGSAPTPAPVTLAPPGAGPALGAAPAVAGVTPTGDARAVAVDNSDDLTLLGFLSSGCTGCAAFWDALQEPGRLELPDRTRVVIVTKGPDREVPAEVRTRATGRVPVVMSTDAWADYQVPGSPFFVLVDGATGRKVGQGVANHVGQLAELVRRAEHDRGAVTTGGGRGRGEGSLGGPAREGAADDVLRAAGIHPGDPSLYPRTLDDVFPFGRPTAPAPRGPGAAS
jgi:hypothetical protein